MLRDPDLVSIQEVREKVEKAYAAWLTYKNYSQEQIDPIVEAVAAAGRENAIRLAEMAVEETGYGNVPDKIAKNLLNADLLPRKMRGMRVVGLLRELPDEKIVEIGVPMGVVAAILPTTNPTSTAIYKTLIALKAGNGIVLSPHPRAKNCTCETVRVLTEAAISAGAPADLIQCIYSSTKESTDALMRHRRTAIILSTGGPGIVRAAYSSGKPALGVGPGNVPVLIDRTANVSEAMQMVVSGKRFDYGTVCSSEQTVVAEQALRATIFSELKANKAFLCDAQQSAALAKLLVTPNFGINPDCVGQSPQKLAQMAGFPVPADASILACEIGGVGKQHPLSMEKLSPVLALHFVPDFASALNTCEAVLKFGGLGHTCVIFAQDDARIREFGMRMPAFRVLVNTASPQGSTGITTNVFPSMTLGCGAIAGNITSDNVGPQHLVNIKRLAYFARKAEDVLTIPEYRPAPAAAPPPAQANVAASMSKQDIAAAVEKYLQEKGIPVQLGAGNSPAAPAPAAAPGPAGEVVAQVVDRFLASRSPLPRQAPACATPAAPPAAPAPSKDPASPAATTPEAPKPTPVDFVCERDVRDAIKANRKIYVTPKAIITPSARDLDTVHQVIVPSDKA